VEPLTSSERIRRALPRQRGFTLIELLVVVVIAGIALAMVAIQGFPGARRDLRFEAERMAQLLALAREEAQVRGQPLRLQADESGYRFLVLRERQWRPLTDDADLRERAWGAPTAMQLQRPDGVREVEFGRDAVDVPFTLRLSRDGDSVAILANGLGLFEVR
jgi:general secretion pathway protein H